MVQCPSRQPRRDRGRGGVERDNCDDVGVTAQVTRCIGGADAKLVFNTHLMVRHISFLVSWARSGYFTYSGRRLEGEKRFAEGECAMLTASSASYATLRQGAAFDFGVAQLPYYDDVKGAPHHSLIGGAGLWVLAGKKAAEYKGAARFLGFLARPEIQAEWHQRTGYVPVTRAAYEHTRKQGFYGVHPGQEIALKQLLGEMADEGLLLGPRLAIARIERWLVLLPAAVLSALVIVQTFDGGRALVIDARLGGVAVGAVAAWRRVPFAGVVVVAAMTTALIRAA